jgi:hypothetical protein
MNFLFHHEHTDPDTAFEQHLQRLDAKREAEQERKSEMAMTKNYLLKLLELCSDEDFGQQAVEAAISHGTLPLTYDLDADLNVIFGPPITAKEGTRYDELCTDWRQICREHETALAASYLESGLLEEILRPVPLPMTPAREAIQ